MRIVVFGGSGFIGSRLVARLLPLQHTVVIADIAPSQSHPNLCSRCDVRDAGAVREACAGADVIYNLAAVHRDDVRPRSLYREVNVDGAANICAAASAHEVDRIVFTSSVAIYGFSAGEADEDTEPAPFNDYGKTKLDAEAVFRSWYQAKPGRTLTIVRPTVVFGEGNRGNVFTLIDQIRRRRFAMVGSGDNVKSIAYVENVAAFLEHVLSRPPGFDVYNSVDKPDYRTRDLVSTIRRQLGMRGEPASIPYPLANAIGAICDAVAAASGRTLPISRIRVQKFCAPSRFSNARAMASGFVAPVSLEEGLRRTIAEEAARPPVTAVDAPELAERMLDTESRLKAAAPRRRIAVVGSYTIVTFRGWLIEDMVAQGHTVFACAPELSAPDLARLEREGAAYQRIGLERTGLNPFQDIAHVTRLAGLFRRLEVDVVLAQTTKAMIAGCLAARLAGVPRIFAIVEGLGYAFTDGPERKRRLVRAVLAPAMKVALAVCDGVFVLNSDDRAYLIGLGILSPKQTVVQIAGTGLDLDHYAYVPPTPGPPRFLLIARMIRDKGVVEYVEAARIVKAKHPEARFCLLGPIDTHPGSISREQISAWEAEGVVEYLGVTDDVRPYLADCTVYVLPSYREGMPRTIMEAMAIGRPVIATDVPGCRDAVEHGVTGWLVPPRDVEAMAEAMAEAMDQERGACSLTAQFGLSSRHVATRRFSAQLVSQATLRAIQEVEVKS